MNIWMKELKKGSDKWMDERMYRWMDDGLMSGKGKCSVNLIILNANVYLS